jgi:hypothetical protein
VLQEKPIFLFCKERLMFTIKIVNLNLFILYNISCIHK